MRFAEIFEKYKDGTASEEERKYVEDELEKNELINEYLGEKMMFDIPDFSEESNQNEIKKIKRVINGNMWKRIIAAMAVIVLLILCAYGASERIFYNPKEKAEGIPQIEKDKNNSGEDSQAFWANVSAFTWLLSPGTYVYGGWVDSLGWGKYNVTVDMSDFYGNNGYHTQIIRGEKRTDLQNELWCDVLEEKELGAFCEAGPHTFGWEDEEGEIHYEQGADERTSMRNELEKLPESCFVSAYISFEDDYTLEEVEEFVEELPEDGYARWAAVRTDDDGSLGILGFNMDQSGVVTENSKEFEEKFPYFNLVNLEEEATPEVYETHFKSLLKYMTYQQEFLHVFIDEGRYYSNTDYYESALKYVEEHGVKVYGLYLLGSTEAMREIEKSPEIASFKISEVKLSLQG